jgi:excinuclease Cho
MLQQSRRVEFRRTAGDIGALLLESRLIKEMQPLYNKKLRRTREMCTLHFGNDAREAPRIMYARDCDFAVTTDLFGLFATRKAAIEKLRAVIDMERLCPALSGLETLTRGRACFARQIGRCLGACTGEESAEEHHCRLRHALEAMRIIVWPYAGPMGIVEECDGWRQTHVIDHWFYIGSMDERERSFKRPPRRSFDIDTYKILARPMVRGELHIEPIEPVTLTSG